MYASTDLVYSFLSNNPIGTFAGLTLLALTPSTFKNPPVSDKSAASLDKVPSVPSSNSLQVFPSASSITSLPPLAIVTALKKCIVSVSRTIKNGSAATNLPLGITIWL